MPRSAVTKVKPPPHSGLTLPSRQPWVACRVPPTGDTQASRYRCSLGPEPSSVVLFQPCKSKTKGSGLTPTLPHIPKCGPRTLGSWHHHKSQPHTSPPTAWQHDKGKGEGMVMCFGHLGVTPCGARVLHWAFALCQGSLSEVLGLNPSSPHECSSHFPA